MVIIIITIIIKINYKENVVLNRNPTKKTKVAFIIYLYLMGKGGDCRICDKISQGGPREWT